MVEWQSADQEVRGSILMSANIISIYLNEELNQKGEQEEQQEQEQLVK